MSGVPRGTSAAMEDRMGTDEQKSGAYEGWAILELMGHRRLAGFVSEVAQYGTAMVRIDIPSEGEDGQAITQFYGGSSIYALTPVSEEAARAVARHHQPRPVSQYELTPPVESLSALSSGSGYGGDDPLGDGDEYDISDLPL